MNKSFIISVFLFLLLMTGSVDLFAQQRNFYLGLQTGVFLPSSNLVYGNQIITYEDDSPVDLYVDGFGSGGDFNLRLQYFFSNLGIHFDGGVRILHRYIIVSLAPDGDEDEYDNTLNLFPVEVGLVYRFLSDKDRIVPYYSAGICGYYGTMGMKHDLENVGRDYNEATAFSIGMYHALGIYIAIYHDLLLNFEVKMNYATGTWKLENEDINYVRHYDELNTGGTSFKLGLAFRF